MRPADVLRLALSNLGRRKLRTALTLFAVVIGATLVSLMVSLGAGLQEFVAAQLRATVPPDSILISASPQMGQLNFGGLSVGGDPQEVNEEGLAAAMRDFRPLTEEQVSQVLAVPGVERVDPQVFVTADSVRLPGSDRRYQVNLEALPSYAAAHRNLVEGRVYSDEETGVCVIAAQFLNVFGWSSPEEAVGQQLLLSVRQGAMGLRILLGRGEVQRRDFPCTVIGVAERSLASSTVIVPLADGIEMARYSQQDEELYSDGNPGPLVIAKVSHPGRAAEVARRIRDLGLGALTRDDLLGLIGSIFGIIEAALSLFGIIALAVASLGIVNTLVMATYERTAEIGVMKAVGASRGAIRVLFTAEGAAVGFFGGVIGIVSGWVLGRLINAVAHATFIHDFPTFQISVFPWWLVVGVIFLTTFVAFLAALYPANRAAGLDPIAALRHE